MPNIGDRKMSLKIIKNQIGYVNPANAITDTGWTVSNGYAVHTSCNSGIIKSRTSFGLIVGHTYVISYPVDQYISGGVNVLCGTTAGTSRTADGMYTQSLLCAGNGSLSFFSDGALRVGKVKFYDAAQPDTIGTTISFHERSNTWGAEYSGDRELMIKFIDQFFCLQNGKLWLSESNPIRNNFFGVQYSSKLTILINGDPTVVKVFFSERVESNKRWFSPNKGDIYIKPTEGKSLGMSSRLKKNNFKNYQGSFFADFLRNMDDPRFNDQLTALFEGAELRGRVMQLTLQNEDTDEAILFEIDVKSATSNYSY